MDEVPIKGGHRCCSIKPLKAQPFQEVGNEFRIISFEICNPKRCVVRPEITIDVVGIAKLALAPDDYARSLDHRRVVIACDPRRGYDRNTTLPLFGNSNIKSTLQLYEVIKAASP